MARPKAADPLIAALIAKLPAPGADFPPAKQKAWLKLMAMAFGAVYGGDVAASLEDEATAKPAPARAAPPPPKPKPSFPFVIDAEGFVRRGNGNKARVKPDEITDTIYDLRGMDGDLRAIVWADDSTGLNGRDLNIASVA